MRRAEERSNQYTAAMLVTRTAQAWTSVQHTLPYKLSQYFLPIIPTLLAIHFAHHSFNRILFGMELLPITSIDKVLKHSQLEIPKTITKPLILSLPESPRRRKQFFELTKAQVWPLFEGVRQLFRATWMSCALSYSAMASLALDAGVMRLAIAEDDVVLPENFEHDIVIVEEYLDKVGNWDMFSGLIADLNPETKIYSAEVYKGVHFVTINKMTSTVFNIYNTSLLQLLSKWDPMYENVLVNTIDRYIENQVDLKIVVTVPFFVGHREEAKSTIWEHSNTAYIDMITRSELRLLALLKDFNAGMRDQESSISKGQTAI